VQFDGLDAESRALVLSTLPEGTGSVFARPMDKGLSGARVLAVRYRFDHMWTKSFVVKIGDIRKLEQEAEAMEELVAPFIPGIERPVFRIAHSKAILVQELRGLETEPHSLRVHIRQVDGSDAVVTRLLNSRLDSWYQRNPSPVTQVGVREAFAWHLSKAPGTIAAAVPDGWDDWWARLPAMTGLPPATEGDLEDLLDSRFAARLGVMHGDLHTQNVIVDPQTNECWPIDFGWCAKGFPALIDLAMLECSIKFLAMPMRADLTNLIILELSLASSFLDPEFLDGVPYSQEINRCVKAIVAVRRYAAESLSCTEQDYSTALAAMTYALSGHSGLNRPYVLASLHILLSGGRR
jgi:hypothetical protein